MLKKAIFAALSLLLVLSVRSVGTADASSGYLSVDFACSPTGGVDALLVWASSGGATSQWVDISLLNNGWRQGTFGAVTTTAASQSVIASGLMPSAVYFARINQQYAGGYWEASPTFVFHTPASCARIFAKPTLIITVKDNGDDNDDNSSESTTATPPAINSAGDNCHPNYYGACLSPDAVDYDCEGGGGNGPSFIKGPVYITGSDPFELDRDGDGVGCNE